MSRKKKKIKFKDLPRSIKIQKIVTWVMLIVGVGCLAYFGFYMKQSTNTHDNYERISKRNDSNNTDINGNVVVIHLNGDEEAPEILEEFVGNYQLNKSLIGWIKINDTQIDYPVMQSTNNEYYLDHNFDQEKDKNGSIYIDCECSIWPRSQNLIVYGHNMKSGRMFGELKKFKNESFYKDHPIIEFDTLYEKGLYQIVYVFPDIVYDEAEVTFKYYQFINANSKEEWDSAMNYMAEKSMYDTGNVAVYGDQLITLSTCDYQKDAERFVVVAKKIK